MVVEYESNVITLREPWSGPEVSAGSAVRNSTSGGTFNYVGLSNDSVASEWQYVEAEFGGEVWENGTYDTSAFRPGTTFVKPIILVNYYDTEPDAIVEWRDVEIRQAEDLVVAEDTTITLYAGAGDADGDALIYEWTQIEGPTVALSDAHAANPTFQSPDLFDGQVIRFEVEVSDGEFTISREIALTVDGVNDPPSDLVLDNVRISENAADGTIVGTVDGSDVDAGDTLTYSLADGADGRFVIDANSGEITVADGSLLDYETATSHDMMVRVTDSGGATYDEVITINVADVNETPDPTHEGRSGDDQLYGGSGHDVMYGYSGQDQIYGDDGDDQIYGGSDDDQLFGDAGDDRIDGGDGKDQIYGGSGHDVIYGYAGDDQIYGGDGENALYGGDGADVFFIMDAQSEAHKNTVSGGRGGNWTDTIELQDSSGGSDIGDYGRDWTLELEDGSSVESSDTSSGGGWIDLTDDARGVIVLQDGTEIDFTGVEHIQW